MALSAAQYGRMLIALLPRGEAWSLERTADIRNQLHGMAMEFARIDARGDSLVREAMPDTTLELLSEWETVAGLPGECTGQLETVALRRAALVARLTTIGGQSRQYFIDLAAALGFEITIEEFKPFTSGSVAGTAITNGDWAYAWRVNAPETTVRSFVAGSCAGEPLGTWGYALLECAIGRVKPAHTILIFGYGG